MLKIDAKRHIAKTISWRVIGTIDTIILSWIISGDPLIGLSIGGFEVVTKMTLYYLHERAWYRFGFGIQRPRKSKGHIKWEPKKNSGTQIAFIQDETENMVKRLKVIQSNEFHREYHVLASSYNKETGERFSDITFHNSKQQLEEEYNIQID